LYVSVEKGYPDVKGGNLQFLVYSKDYGESEGSIFTTGAKVSELLIPGTCE
jgi:hypothetical protein